MYKLWGFSMILEQNENKKTTFLCGFCLTIITDMLLYSMNLINNTNKGGQHYV